MSNFYQIPYCALFFLFLFFFLQIDCHQSLLPAIKILLAFSRNENYMLQISNLVESKNEQIRCKNEQICWRLTNMVCGPMGWLLKRNVNTSRNSTLNNSFSVNNRNKIDKNSWLFLLICLWLFFNSGADMQWLDENRNFIFWLSFEPRLVLLNIWKKKIFFGIQMIVECIRVGKSTQGPLNHKHCKSNNHHNYAWIILTFKYVQSALCLVAMSFCDKWLKLLACLPLNRGTCTKYESEILKCEN